MVKALTKDVQSRAQTALAESPIYVLRDLHVERMDGRLVLSGSVDTFYHKQVAQEVVRAVAEGITVINSVDVRENAPV